MKQQGDVCIEEKKIPRSARPKSGLVLAEGETTGHAHRLRVPEGVVAELLQEDKGDLYLRVSGGTVELVHEEHKPILIEEGEYQIGRVLEYDYDTEESRQVQD
jgi:hypothetical protein